MNTNWQRNGQLLPTLRGRAEAAVRKPRRQMRCLSAAEARRLVHELEIHRIELETQNQELRQAQAALREAAEVLEQRVAERTAELHDLNTQLWQEVQRRRELEGRLLDISEREQRRVGQELHDGVCSQLTGVEHLIHSLAQDLTDVSNAQARQAREIGRLLQDAMADAHKLAHGLSPVSLDVHGLILGLQKLAARTREVYRRRCSFRGDPLLEVADPAKAMHLYRIAQEAVTNAVKHSGASTIGISLLVQGGSVVLRVRDNGPGLAPSSGCRGGLGLLTMGSRPAAMGGSLAVQHNRRGGLDVVCTVPVGLRASERQKAP